MADPPDHLPGADLLPPAHRDAAGREVRVQGVRLFRPDDHVIAGQPGGIEAAPHQAEQQQILQRRTGLPHGMNPMALWHAIHGPGDRAAERGMDRLAPSVAIPGPPADQIPPQSSGRVQMEPAAVIDADQVVGNRWPSASVPWLGIW